MFIAFNYSSSRTKIASYNQAPKNIPTDNADEASMIKKITEAARFDGPNDLSAIFVLQDISEQRLAIIDEILTTRVPITIFTSNTIIIKKYIDNALLSIINIPVEIFTQFKKGPLSIYCINEELQLIYPEDSLIMQPDLAHRNMIMLDLIGPLCHRFGIDFPLDAALFRLLRHGKHYKESEQWNKILRLGRQTVTSENIINPQIYITMSEAALALSDFYDAYNLASLASKFAEETKSPGRKCYADYLQALAEWKGNGTNIVDKLKAAHDSYINKALENESLLTKIVDLMKEVQLKFPDEDDIIIQDNSNRNVTRLKHNFQ